MQVSADLNDADIGCDPQRQGNGREYRRQKVKGPKTQRKDGMPCEFKSTGSLLDGYPLLPTRLQISHRIGLLSLVEFGA
jgi:hypothetical protein